MGEAMSRVLSLDCPAQVLTDDTNLYRLALCCSEVWIEARRLRALFDADGAYTYTEFEVLWMGNPEEMEGRYLDGR